MTDKLLYQMRLNFGRSGNVEGLFFSREEVMAFLTGKVIHFGEACGKHSDVSVVLGPEDFKPVLLSSVARAELHAHTGDNVSGYNPVNYFEEAYYDAHFDEIEAGTDDDWRTWLQLSGQA